MAIYHLSVKIIARAQGRSAVAAAAYRSASRLYEQHTGLWHDFSRKRGVVRQGILTPANAPSWLQERPRLWNAVEAREQRKDAQLARDICLALPRELTASEQEDLLLGYLWEHFVGRGMVADYAIHHDNPENPHAHVLLTMRAIDGQRFGLKETAWNAKSLLLSWREGWAEASNRALALAGYDRCIDARSYAAQGLAIVPGIKLGVAKRRERHDGRDIVAERLAMQRRIRAINGASILADPSLVTAALTRQQATFTAHDVRRWLKTHTASSAQAEACAVKVLALPTLVPLAPTPRGARQWTTQEMLRCELRLQAHALALAGRGRLAKGLAASGLVSSQSHGLSSEQVKALRHLTGSSHLAVLEGHAGSGKSALLREAKKVWASQGYRVQGVALAGLAAEGLEASSGIASRTLASWEHRLQQRVEAFGSRDVLVVDEAGMVGTRQLERVLGLVRAAGGKVVLVGDTAQLQAIEAGAPLRAVSQAVGVVRLTGIRRQQDTWQQHASVALAEGRISEALDAYRAQGRVHAHLTQAAAMQRLLADWQAMRVRAPAQSQVMLAYRRDEVDQLNQAARKMYLAGHAPGQGRVVQTERGLRDFAVGERLLFLRNDRGLGVRNGTLGTLERIESSWLQVRLDGADTRRVLVDMQSYRHLDYGYASTVHKSQGMTVDCAHVLCSSGFDRHISYVSCTRHRLELNIHWSQESFGGKDGFYRTMARARPKAMALDAHFSHPNPAVTEQKAASALSAEVRLRQAVAFLRQAPLTRAQAIGKVPEVAAQQRVVDDAARSVAHYRKEREDFEQAHPFARYLPWRQPQTQELQTGRVRRLGACQKQSAQAHAEAKRALAALLVRSETKKQAEQILAAARKERQAAEQSLPDLQAAYDEELAEKTQRIALRAKEIERDRQKQRGQERARGGHDVEVER